MEHKIIREAIAVDAERMTNPEATFVSVVGKGANRTPFKVVKNQKTETGMRVIQSLIVPKTMKQEDVLSVLGDDLKNMVKFDKKVEATKFDAFEQQPKDAFKEESLEYVVLDEASGLKGIVGIAKEEKANGMIGKLFSKKSDVIAVDENTAAVSPEIVAKSMDWEIYDEIYNLNDAIRGILAQEMGDASAKVAMVRQCMDNFVAYLDTVFIATKGAKIDLPEFKKLEKEMTQEEKTPEVEKKEDAAPVEAAPSVEKAEATPETKTEAVEPEFKAEEVIKTEVEKAMAPIIETLKTITEKMEKLEGLKDAVSKMEEMVPTVVDKAADTVTTKKSEKANVFKGVFNF